MSEPYKTVDLSVRVSDGSYEARLSFPVDTAPEQVHKTFMQWIAALGQALEVAKEQKWPTMRKESGGLASS